ncbi:MAG: PD-(D/E)XK nuclease family protein [Phycisphaerae bacterium]
MDNEIQTDLTYGSATHKYRLTFEDATHTYRIDGVVVPSVTRILQASKLCDVSHYKVGAAAHGAEVHKMLEEWDRDDGAPIVRPDIAGYLEGWRKFRRAWPFVIVDIEKMVCCPAGRYAGRVDRIVERKERDCPPERWVLDIKTGRPERWHRVQTAMYAMVSNCTGRACVYLNNAGAYKLDVHFDESDYAAGSAAVTLAAWRTNK